MDKLVRSKTSQLCILTLVLLLCFLSSGCSTKRQERISATLLNPQQVYDAAVQAIEDRDLLKAKRMLEGIEYDRESRATLEPLVRLRLADIAYFMGTDISLIDARSMYLNFVTLYTDHPEAPYAQLQAGVCSLKQANHPSRDQTETLIAIRDLKRIIAQFPDSPYAVVARDRIRQAETTLAAHEFLVGNFYLKRNEYKAAIKRFETVLEEYPKFEDRDRLLFHLGKALMLEDRPQEARIHLERLQREFPEGEWAEQAAPLIAQLGS